jgi:NADH-quinone oxidoreductase subunit J
VTDYSTPLFYIVAAVVLIPAVLMVTFRNLIYSAAAMILCFIGVAMVFVTLNAELLAISQVLIYVGAISILIMFAIMLTRQRSGEIRLFFHRQAWLALPAALALAVTMAVVLSRASFSTTPGPRNPGTSDLSNLLFDQYAFPFELVSLVLLVAIVGAILLARRERRR